MTQDEKRKMVGEYAFIKRLITEIYPAGVVSIVSDSFDYWATITQIAPRLKAEILNRTPDQFGLAKVVFRPDSGDPVRVICGDPVEFIPDDTENPARWAGCILYERVADSAEHGKLGKLQSSGLFTYRGEYYRASINVEWNRHDKQYYYIDGYDVTEFTRYDPTPEEKGSIECLAEIFGTTTNDLGYKTLNPRVGLIYGDSITIERQQEIYERLVEKGYASDNVVFGVGSYTYNYITRDTCGFAMKATYIELDGVGHAIYKDPKTDSGKKSARGLLRVEKDSSGNYVLLDNVTPEQERGGELRDAFIDGKILINEAFADIRTRLASYL